MAGRPTPKERKYRELRRKGMSRKNARALTEAEHASGRDATADPPQTPRRRVPNETSRRK